MHINFYSFMRLNFFHLEKKVAEGHYSALQQHYSHCL